MKKILTLTVLLWGTVTLMAQDANDCVQRIFICGDAALNNNSFGPGVQENPGGCLSTGEHQSAWYQVNISSSGTLEFTLDPLGGGGQDYDFAIWGPNPTCGSLGAPIRCSYAGSSCGFCPQTGLGMGATDFSEGAGGDGFVAPINATAGGVYYILIDNFLSSSTGFILNWTGTAGLGEILANAGPDREVCAPSTFVIAGSQNGGPASSVSWTASPPDALAFMNNTTVVNPTVSIPAGYTGTITYTLNAIQSDCAGSDEVEITIVEPEVNANTTPASCNAATGTVITSLTGITLPATYIWSNGAGNVPNLNNVAPGTYTVTVTSAGGGCSATGTFVVEPDNTPLEINGSVNPTLCTSSMGSSIIPSVVAVPPPFVYAWSNGATTSTLFNIPPGDYTVTISSNGGCTGTQTFTVESNDVPLTVTGNIIPPLCNSTNGSISITTTGAPPSYTYSWSTGSTTQNQSNLAPGNYSVTVTSVAGCTGEQSFDVEPNIVPLTVTGAITRPLCTSSNGSITASASGAPPAYTFSWSNGGTGATQSNLASGSYTVTVTSVAGCTGEQTFEVEPNIVPLTVTGNIIPPLCTSSNGSISISTSGAPPAYVYNWTNGSTTQNQSNLAPGSYTVTVTSVAGCTGEQTFDVDPNLVPLTVTGNIVPPLCAASTGTITINATGAPPAYTYSWSNGATTQNLNSLSGGDYTVTVTSVAGCIGEQTFTVEPNIVTLNVNGNIIAPLCTASNGSINVSVSGAPPAYTYNWSTGATTQNLNSLPGGNYSLTVTSAAGCTGEQDFTVEPNIVDLNVNGLIVKPLCASSTGAITLSVSGAPPGYVYNWTSGATTQNLNNLPAGNYSVTVISAAGCIGEQTFDVESNDVSLNVNGLIVKPLCTSSTGAITLSVSGAPPSYVYNWTTGATTQNLTNLPVGNYLVTVTSVAGCTGEQSFEVEANIVDLNINANPTPAICDSPTGQITAAVTGGLPPFQYIWSTGAITQGIFNLAPGDYTVIATSNAGCTGEGLFTVVSTQIPPTIASVVADAVCTSATGSIDITPGGGVGPYEYEWSTGATTQDLQNLASGTYTVQVTDSRGCINTKTHNLSFGALTLDIDATVQNLYCNLPNGSIQADIPNGVGPFVYQWSNGGTNQIITGLAVGTYTVSITDSRGCVGTEIGQVSALPLPILLGIDDRDNCDFYVLPPVTVNTGSLNSVSYFTGLNGTGTQHQVGDTLIASDFLYVYSNLGANCILQDSFQLDIRNSSELTIQQNKCAGESIVVNNKVYDQTNPTGTELLVGGNAAGCDSTIYVNLQFYPLATTAIALDLCPSQSITVGTQTFNQTNPSGSVLLNNGSWTGCDSLVTVSLQYFTPAIGQLNRVLCPGESVMVGTQTFNQVLPSGTVTLPSASIHGCDSTVQVALSFLPIPQTFIAPTLCADGSLTIGTSTFNAANPMGSATLTNFQGCDSIVFVELQFYPPALGSVNTTLCVGESLVVGNQTFNESNTSGSVLLTDASINGCDSTVQVSLSFSQTLFTNLTPSLCAGESITISGTQFNAANPTGVIPLLSLGGCDSIVQVSIQFYPPAVGQLASTLCLGTSLIVGNQTFNEATPNGSVVLPAASINGCDSTVQVSLSFAQTLYTTVAPTLCPGGSINVSGVVFDATNPIGDVPLVTSGGCDSIVQVSVGFFAPAVRVLNPVRCADEIFALGNQVFSVTNPSGTVILANASSNGCDSTITVAGTFIPPVSTSVSPALCLGESYTVSGITFDLNNPTGVLNLNSVVTGCDSLVSVSISYYPAATGTYSATLCDNESFTLGTTLFNKSNPSGSVVLGGAALNGCDSTVAVSLNFNPILQTSLSPKLCIGEDFNVNGTIFNAANPNGSVTIQSALTGCDSIIQVAVQYYPPALGVLQPSLCEGASYPFGNQTFNAANPTGVVVLPSAALHGCDSIVNVSLTFVQTLNTFLAPQLCVGETYTAAGQTFSAANPNGNVTLSSVAGCDSIVHVNLSYYAPALGSVNRDLCDGQSLTIGGTIFNAANPSGSVVLEGSSFTGCDSTVSVSVNFVPVINTFINRTLCLGESYTNGGVTFNAANPNGNIALTAEGGCDSVVHVAVAFYPVAKGVLNVEKCPGQKFTFANQQFSETNPTGSVMLENATIHGCDSIVDIAVKYHYLTLELGEDQSIVVGDSVFLVPVTNAEIAKLTWTPGTYLSDRDTLLPYSKPDRSVVYVLKIVDSIGCIVEDRLTISVNEPDIYAPNIFSPDGDNYNDYFTIFAGRNITNIQLMRVYDRWGTQLFERRNFPPNDEPLGWDGSFNGTKMNPGVFIWYAEINLPGGKTVLIKGDVTLKN